MNVKHITIEGVNPEGYTTQITVELEEDETITAVSNKLAGILTREGWKPKPAASVSPPRDPHQSAEFGYMTYEAREIDCEFLSNKWYYKVKGAGYMQHGVRVWGETLKAIGIDPAEIDPAAPPSLEGYTAKAELNAEGKPKKVVKLWKE